VKNTLAQKKEQEKKHKQIVAEIWSSIQLYIQATEPLIIKRKVTPSGSLYEKVHESDVKKAVYEQWKIQIPTEVVIKKTVWEQV
jgi:ribosomal protein L9